MELGTPVEHLLREGRHLLKEGWTHEAMKRFQAALGADPQNAEAHTLMGTACRRFRRAKESLKHLREAHRLDPLSDEITKELVHTVACLGKKEDRLTSLREAVERAPENPFLQWQVAKVLTEMGRHEEAYRAFMRSASLTPNTEQLDPDLLGDTAMSAMRTERLSEAVALFETALEVEPGYFDRAVAERKAWEKLLKILRRTG